MDGLSHIFWTATLYKLLREKTGKPLNLWHAAFWGTFPDIFAFGIPLVILSSQLMRGKIPFVDSVLESSVKLYSYSHSIIIFTGAIILVETIALINRRTLIFPKNLKSIPWEMGGWLMHILIDIPTHSSFLTPFLWPLSDFKIKGVQWSSPWFMVLDYTLIILVYFAVWRKNKSKKISQEL